MLRLDKRAKELELSRYALLEVWLREKLDDSSASVAEYPLARSISARYASPHEDIGHFHCEDC